MQLNYYENIKNKNNDLRNKIHAFVEKYNPRPQLIEEGEENGVVVKVYEAR